MRRAPRPPLPHPPPPRGRGRESEWGREHHPYRSTHRRPRAKAPAPAPGAGGRRFGVGVDVWGQSQWGVLAVASAAGGGGVVLVGRKRSPHRFPWAVGAASGWESKSVRGMACKPHCPAEDTPVGDDELESAEDGPSKRFRSALDESEDDGAMDCEAFDSD